MTCSTSSPFPGRPGVVSVTELVHRLSSAESDLTSALGSGADAVVDSNGHAFLLRQAQLSLQQSERRFRTLIEKSADVIALLSVDGTVLYDSPAVTRALGYTSAELVGQSVFDLFHADDRLRAREIFAEICAAPRASATVVLRCRHKDGRYRSVEGTATNMLHEPGVHAVVLNYHDITERVEAEAALHASEAHYRSVLQNVEAGVIVHAADLRITAFNPKALAILGVTAAEMQQRNPLDPLWSRVRPDGSPIAPEDLPANRAQVTRQPVRDVILGLVRPSQGDFVWVLVNANPVLTPAREVAEVIVSFVDVTARIRAEEAVCANATFTEDVLNSLRAHVSVLDRAGTIIAVNEAWRHFARENGAGSKDFVGHNYLAVCRESAMHGNAAGVDETAIGIRAVLDGAQTQFTFEYPCHSPAASRWFRMHVSPLSGGRSGVVVSHHDITEHRQNLEALRTSEKRFKTLFEQAAVGVAQTDAQTCQFVQANQKFCAILDYDWAELRNLPFTTITHPQDVDGSLETLQKLKAGTIREASWEKRYVRRDGSIVWVTMTVSSMGAPDEAPEFFIAIMQDITASKQLEEQFRQSQKMEAIGQLSGGVAHDFNNMLAVIKGHIGLLEASGRVTPAITESIQQISAAADRAANLTRQLLLFSRRQVMQPRILDLGAATKDIVKMLRRVVGEQVTIEVRRASNPLLVRADAGMIDQVLLNLVVNARDAMPHGGKLAITTDWVELTADTLARRPETRPGTYIRLGVTDTGTGIAPEILTRIFEPFFTTKEVGKGTGLGLATVYGIVCQHEGWIDVHSEVGRGTTFEVYFPYAGDAAVRTGGDPTAPAPASGTETILLVEDEPTVRLTLEAVLLHHGYRVFSAKSGVHALQVWLEHEPEIDLLLTDVVMPDNLTGKELAERLLRQKPALRVIYMSGYNQEFTGSDLLREGENFLAKPFEPGGLLAAVRAILDDRSEAVAVR